MLMVPCSLNFLIFANICSQQSDHLRQHQMRLPTDLDKIFFCKQLVFFEGQNLIWKYHDSRQNVNGNQSKKQSFKGYF